MFEFGVGGNRGCKRIDAVALKALAGPPDFPVGILAWRGLHGSVTSVSAHAVANCQQPQCYYVLGVGTVSVCECIGATHFTSTVSPRL
jgi:hypothetical protein